jgi:hypothetical protein
LPLQALHGIDRGGDRLEGVPGLIEDILTQARRHFPEPLFPASPATHGQGWLRSAQFFKVKGQLSLFSFKYFRIKPRIRLDNL